MIKAVIFDMDGLLLDSERLYFMNALRVARELGRDLPESLYRDTIGRAWPDGEKIYRAYYGADFDLEYLMRQTEAYTNAQVGAGGIPVKAGARELLRWLKSRGVPVAVATSTAAGRARGKLETAGLLEYFPVLVAGDQVARSKPEPDIYLAAAAALGVAPEGCAALEDSPAGIRAASAAGMAAIMVPDMIPPTPEIAALAAAVVPSLAEALELLAGMVE